MGHQRVHRITNWRSVQPRHIMHTEPTTQALEKDIAMANPWRAETEGWSFNPKEITLLRPTAKRKRTFTGQIRAHRSGLPSTLLIKNKLLKMGVIAFVAADLFLAAVFIASVL